MITPIGFDLAVERTSQLARSALPDAPVLPEPAELAESAEPGEPAPTRVARGLRVALAGALRGTGRGALRAAAHVEPGRTCPGVPAH